MALFDTDGVSIAHEIAGTGKSMLLVDGFAATAEDNWARTDRVAALTGTP